jgi:hypothetical protein
MDAVQLALVSSAVTALVKLIQNYLGAITGVWALGIYLRLSALGVGLWVLSQPSIPDKSWAFGLFAAWVQIALGAAGLSATVEQPRQRNAPAPSPAV